MPLRPGNAIVADAYYAENGPDEPDIKVHSFARRTEMGLGVTACGLVQITRAGWFIFDPANEYQSKWPVCRVCWPEGRTW